MYMEPDSECFAHAYCKRQDGGSSSLGIKSPPAEFMVPLAAMVKKLEA